MYKRRQILFWSYCMQIFSGRAWILEQIAPAAGPKVVWQCFKQFELTVTI